MKPSFFKSFFPHKVSKILKTEGIYFFRKVFGPLSQKQNSILTNWYGCGSGFAGAVIFTVVVSTGSPSLGSGGRTYTARRGTHGACTATEPSFPLSCEMY